MAKRSYPRIKAAPKRARNKVVFVRGHCRRKGQSAYKRAEQTRRAMPF